MSLYKSRYRNESTRLPGWNYSSPGFYFITICTKKRVPYFGEIVNGKLKYSEIGNIAREFWKEIPNHFPMVRLDEFIIMPDHIHGILEITPPVTDLGVPTMGIIINQYKRICTITAKQRDIEFVWQSRFYDRVIRNQRELSNVRFYIITNPVRGLAKLNTKGR